MKRGPGKGMTVGNPPSVWELKIGSDGWPEESREMWKMGKSLLAGGGGEGEEEDEGASAGEESGGFFYLSPTQKMYAFGGCLLGGLLCMILSLIVFAKPIKFAVLFTIGNLLAVGSTAFLIGASQQMRMMFDSSRIIATAIYLGCVVMALVFALWMRSKILTILAVICEMCALIWYCLSYIPFARQIVSNLMVRLFDTEL
ncbi:hypothetical protein MLD38_030437 [Melastoma candidum]|uniref:Uncharacterized protein n=1 Tax=Melastoma candidum TaxID=119954 RepID=A0ACB9MMV0_9MYRT|nr:hypothetical protein MLD38_030437 [Melastoma candidum]